MSVVTGFSLSEKTFKNLEKNRGLIPRSTYVENILAEYFNKKNKSGSPTKESPDETPKEIR